MFAPRAWDPARLRVSSAVVRVPRAVYMVSNRAVRSRVARMYPEFSNPDRSYITASGEEAGQRGRPRAGARANDAECCALPCCPAAPLPRLFPQLPEIPELVEGRRIGQGIQIGHRPAMNHVPDRQLGDLAADGPGYVRYLNDFARHMVRAGLLPNSGPDPLHQLRRQG